jgi:hypothetical protein
MVTLIITMESEVQAYLVYCISFLDDRCTCSLPDNSISRTPNKNEYDFWYNIVISITIWHEEFRYLLHTMYLLKLSRFPAAIIPA